MHPIKFNPNSEISFHISSTKCNFCSPYIPKFCFDNSQSKQHEFHSFIFVHAARLCKDDFLHALWKTIHASCTWHNKKFLRCQRLLGLLPQCSLPGANGPCDAPRCKNVASPYSVGSILHHQGSLLVPKYFFCTHTTYCYAFRQMELWKSKIMEENPYCKEQWNKKCCMLLLLNIQQN